MNKNNLIKALALSSMLSSSSVLLAQEKSEFSAKISGHVWVESIYDTRQTASARDGSVMLYPKAVNLDANGVDINASPSFNMLSVFSRARIKVTTPDFLNAKVSGLIEGDFAGSANDKIGLFRLRHAMMKLNWSKTELLAGMYWHPMFTLEAFPMVNGWGGAVPFHPLSRAPQVRFTYKPNGSHRLMVSASSQLDFKSTGPQGSSMEYAKNAAVPETNIQYTYGLDKNIMLGATLGYKVLKPSLVNSLGLATDQTIGSYHLNVFGKAKFKKNTLRFGGIYGQNMTNFVMLGGYAVKDIDSNGDINYTNTETSAYWFDYTSPIINNKYSLGLYAGYTKNHGAEDMVTGDVYSRGSNMDYAYRVTPRIIYGTGPLKIRAEVSYDIAAYGEADNYLKVQNAKEANNYRFLLASSFSF